MVNIKDLELLSELIKTPDLNHQLSIKNIHIKLNKLKLRYKSSDLILYLNDLKIKTNIFFKQILKNSENKTGKEISYNENINPILWQLGHVSLFYLNNTIRILTYKTEVIELEPNKNYSINFNKIYNILELFKKNLDENDIDYYNYYESFVTTVKNRYKLLNKIDAKDLLECYNKIIEFLINYIKQTRLIKYKEKDNSKYNELNNVDKYLIMLGILHNDMHYEAFLFTGNYLNYRKPINLYALNNYDIINLEDTKSDNFIKIKGGFFKQGCNENESYYLTFDNEQPIFYKYINDFEVSKYTITEGEYLEFIEQNGYETRKWWTFESWQFINNNEIKSPLYWYYDSDLNTWIFKNWDKSYNITKNSLRPIIHVSWYEAKAYCKWRGVRLISESEWEYLATNKGKTKFPWGDEIPSILNSNINYYNGDIINVNEKIIKKDIKSEYFNKKINKSSYGENYDGICHLIGNVWEWCEDNFYPYERFKIDPVYREMSYPNFGKNRICRGGAWSCSNYLINSKYRNSQPPECRIQYIGFRVCKL